MVFSYNTHQNSHLQILNNHNKGLQILMQEFINTDSLTTRVCRHWLTTKLYKYWLRALQILIHHKGVYRWLTESMVYRYQLTTMGFTDTDSSCHCNSSHWGLHILTSYDKIYRYQLTMMGFTDAEWTHRFTDVTHHGGVYKCWPTKMRFTDSDSLQ